MNKRLKKKLQSVAHVNSDAVQDRFTIEQLKEENKRIKSDNEYLKARLKNVNDDLKTVNDAKNQYILDLESVNKQLENAKHEIEQLLNDKAKIAKERDLLERENVMLLDNISRKEKAINSLREELAYYKLPWYKRIFAEKPVNS